MEDINKLFEDNKKIDYESFKKIILQNKNILSKRKNSRVNVELIDEVKKIKNRIESPDKIPRSRLSFSSVSSNK